MRRRLGIPILALSVAAIAAGGWPDTDVQQPSAAAHHRVLIRDLTFEPATLNVALGDTVTWTNLDLVPHTVTSEEGEEWDSGELMQRESWTQVFRTKGHQRYQCRFHPSMNGSLSVK